ncbi:MAG: SpoIID/LytB domain-containing protein [Flavobacteriia bacterium]
MRYLLAIICLLQISVLKAQQLRIGVLRDHSVKRITFSYNDGSYSIFGDTSDFGAILPNEFVEFLWEKNGVKLKKGTIELGTFKKVYLIQTQLNTSLVLTSKIPALKQRKYEDDFEISAGNRDLTIVNLVDTDNYLAGVVESEGGGGRSLEYYKVQALMSRTYVMKYRGRHKKEGFDLCDRVHCQAYHNMMRYTSLIDTAVKQTHDQIMIDQHGEMIDAYFHANCGGQTCEPQYIWNEEIEYLRSFIDTFCIYTKQATWEKRISQDKWSSFLVSKYNYPIGDSASASMIFTFEQPQRMAFYIHPVFGIPLRDLREEFDLKSTFFSCYPEGTDVVIKGRGFGHGVGLCQEGAMKMAKYGFNYLQIAKYYFPGIIVVNYSEERFYKQKPSPF